MSFVRLVAGCGGCGDSEQDSDDILNFADCCRDLAARLPPLREAGERGGLGDVQPPPSPPPRAASLPGGGLAAWAAGAAWMVDSMRARDSDHHDSGLVEMARV